ncbi:MAG: hypothetical protein EOP11_11140, partial [Proteobacteria bacterium]
MPDQQNRNGDNSRFDKLSKSVLETDHPLFAKVKKELPAFRQRLSARRGSKEKIIQWAKEKRLPQLGGMVLIAAALSFFIYRQITDPNLDYKLGDTAQRHLIAQRTIEMVDEETTEAKRRASTEAVLSVYDYDRRIPAQAKARLGKAFGAMRSHHGALMNLADRKGTSPAELEKSELFQSAKKSFTDALESDISDAQFLGLLQLNFAPRVEKVLVHFLAESNLNLIVSNRDLLKSDAGRGITLNRLDDESERRAEITFHNIGAVIDVEAARADLEA